MSRKSYPSVCWGYSIFLEPRQSNVRRKPLLGISVNKGKREGNRSLPPYVCQDGVEYNDRHKRPRQGTMSYGSQAQGGRAEEQRLYDQAQQSPYRHHCTRCHEDAPHHRGHKRGSNTEADLCERCASSRKAPVTEGAQGAQLQEEGQQKVGSLQQLQHVHAPSF